MGFEILIFILSATLVALIFTSVLYVAQRSTPEGPPTLLGLFILFVLIFIITLGLTLVWSYLLNLFGI